MFGLFILVRRQYLHLFTFIPFILSLSTFLLIVSLRSHLLIIAFV